jgi:hypothetical protein
MSDFSVLVNSSDGFEDCWEPFFLLYQKFWPQVDAPIFLNTERKTWNYPGLDIHCTTVQGKSSETLTWSECLLAALDQISSPLVLYFQEDYFLQQPVLHDRVEAAVKHMMENPDVKHIGLTQHGSAGPFCDYEFSGYQTIDQKAKYRISTQAGLWRVDTLKSYLVACENGWMFEIYGTWRAHRRKECFLTAKFDVSHGGPIVHYLHTGIIKGQWLSQIQNVFTENSIFLDYNKRGFYKPKSVFARKYETAARLLKKPFYFLRQLYKLKLS